MSRRRRVTKAVLAAVLAAGLIASTARLAATQSTDPVYGVISTNSIDPTATLSKGERKVNVGVFLSCEPVQRARVRVTVTFVREGRVTVAEGRSRMRCTAERQRFPVQTKARKGKHFRLAHELTVCALVVTGDDARQWCRAVDVGYQALEAVGLRE